MLLSFATQTAVVVKPGSKEVRGSELPDWGSPKSETSYAGCFAHETASGFDQDGRMAVSDTLDVLMPPDADVEAGDRMVLEDGTYTVVGVRRSPFPSRASGTAHVRATVSKWEG